MNPSFCKNKVKSALWVVFFTCLTLSFWKTSSLYTLFDYSSNNVTMLPTVGFLAANSTRINCRGVLDIIVSGTWKSRPMTSNQKAEMRKFLEIARNGHALPPTLQRKDKKCGNVNFLKTGRHFRALCDQYGSTPCCYNNTCVAKEVEECRCKNCFDTRQSLHAEYADWLPSDKGCHLRKYNNRTACQLLAGRTILFSGDSLMRHMYTSLLLLLRNNTFDGAMKKNVTKDIHDKCTGMFMFTEKICRLQLDIAPRDLCGGQFELIFTEYYHTGLSRKFVDKVKELMARKKVLIIAGIGFHSGFNHRVIMDQYVAPALKVIQKHNGTQFLFAPPHCPGLLKNSWNGQSKEIIEQYVVRMKKELKPHNVPIFDTCNLTSGMESFDGTHFGLGINMLKVQLLLNYIQELQVNNKW
ncbi:uncharacterized protein LOC130010307 [Patella vulgata]|uniref:uncharacterized protein LOC130010307 n=1 Tax=Patella vulgata TaxID=6465 RepID=UPI00217F4D5A|nr:uncharacterized protein LOC130010307 [Patella vulgata]